jgi:hypothetical protein
VVLNQNIAPGVSAFTSGSVPDASQFSQESVHWVTNVFLNCTFRGAFASADAYAYNYLRQSQHAFAEHHLVRHHTISLRDPIFAVIHAAGRIRLNRGPDSLIIGVALCAHATHNRGDDMAPNRDTTQHRQALE